MRVLRYIVVDTGTWAALSSENLYPCCGVKKLPPQNIKVHGDYDNPNEAIKQAVQTGQEVITIIKTEPLWHYRLTLQGKKNVPLSDQELRRPEGSP